MSSIRWVGQHIEVDPPKHPKKITGTRFASILGLNRWSTPFETWCAITRTYEEPFVDTIYTRAGKVIEPKQAMYMKYAYFMSNLVTPEDKFGKDYFKTTFGDFFREYNIYGGMWDYLLVDKDGKPKTVLEMKTTKRAEDWVNGVPEYYAMQAALYAYLLEVDDVIMVCSILEEKDYEHPEDFEPSTSNTFMVRFKVSEKYPDFESRIAKGIDWWNAHVKTGISPDYDTKKDADILKELGKVSIAPDTDMDALIDEAERIEADLAEAYAKLKDKEDRLKTIKDEFKRRAIEQMGDEKTSAEILGDTYYWTVTSSTKVDIKCDHKKMVEDGIFDKYAKTTEKTTYTIRTSKKEN